MKKLVNSKTQDFEEFIEMMNLTKGRNWSELEFDIAYKEEIKIFGDDYSDEHEIEVLKRTLLRLLPLDSNHLKEFSQYLFQKNSPLELDSEDEIYHAEYSYKAFYENRQTIETITKRLARLRENGTLPKKAGDKRVITSKKVIAVFRIAAIKDRQKIKTIITYDKQDDIFSENPDLDRVRICPECSIYFLAKRTDAIYCSVRCGNAARQKLWLKNEEKYQKHLQKKRERYHTTYKDRQKIMHVYKKEQK